MCGEVPVRDKIGAGIPGLRPARAFSTRTPAPGREPSGRASMVLFAGEEVPSPGPSPGDIPTVRCMGWCGGRAVYGVAFPGRPFRGYRDYCPLPVGRGRSAEGAGGVEEIGERCMGRLPPAAPHPGSFHENPRSCAGAL